MQKRTLEIHRKIVKAIVNLQKQVEELDRKRQSDLHDLSRGDEPNPVLQRRISDFLRRNGLYHCFKDSCVSESKFGYHPWETRPTPNVLLYVAISPEYDETFETEQQENK